MKILIVVEHLGLGGGINYVIGVARALQARGHDCRIAHSDKVIPPAHDLAGLVIEYVPDLQMAKTPDDDSSAAILQDLLGRFRPDVVFVHWLRNHCALLHLLGSGIPTVRMFHDYSSLCLRKARQHLPGRRCQRALGWGCLFWGCCFGNPRPGARLPRYTSLGDRLAERRLYRRFDLALVPSHYVSSVLVKNGFRPERIAILPYFTPVGRGTAACRDVSRGAGAAGIAGQRTLLFCGQVISPKGLQVLVRALSLVKSDCRLVVVGDGDYMPFVRRMAARLLVEDRIEFRGWLRHTEMEQAYQSADVVVVPSIWDDPCPIVGIEAMASGKPVVAFDVGGISDWLRDKVTGVLVGDISPLALAAAIDSLVMNRDASDRMGNAARAVAVEEYVLERHIDRLTEHLSRVLRSPRPQRDDRGADWAGMMAD